MTEFEREALLREANRDLHIALGIAMAVARKHDPQAFAEAKEFIERAHEAEDKCK